MTDMQNTSIADNAASIDDTSAFYLDLLDKVSDSRNASAISCHFLEPLKRREVLSLRASQVLCEYFHAEWQRDGLRHFIFTDEPDIPRDPVLQSEQQKSEHPHPNQRFETSEKILFRFTVLV